MKITVIAAGKIKTGPEADIVSEFTKRLPWQISFVEIEEKKPLPPAQKSESEGKKILAAIPEGAFAVALDKGGKTLSSEEFAKALEAWRGRGDIAFLIGGADGLSDKVLARADAAISFGPMTFPHLLARAMLLEQLYRAHAILSGHPYHK